MKLDNTPATDAGKAPVEEIKVEVPVAGQDEQSEASEDSKDKEHLRRLSTESSERSAHLKDTEHVVDANSELKFGSQSNECESETKPREDGIPPRPRTHHRTQNLEAVDEEDLGIYEDTAEGDDLTDTEDIAKLREKLKARALEKANEAGCIEEVEEVSESVHAIKQPIKRQVPTIAELIKDNETEKARSLGAVFRRSRTKSEPTIGIGMSYMQCMDGDSDADPIDIAMELIEAR